MEIQVHDGSALRNDFLESSCVIRLLITKRIFH